MKQPDPAKYDSFLARFLSPAQYSLLVYKELVVWVDSQTQQPKGYYLAIVTEEWLYWIQLKDKKLTSQQSYRLYDLTLVEQRRDAAAFFADQIQNDERQITNPDQQQVDSQHVRVTISDAIASPFKHVDFYTFYSDSQFFAHLHQYCVYAQSRQALQQPFYSALNAAAAAAAQQQSGMRASLISSGAGGQSKLSALNRAAARTLFEYLENQLLSHGPYQSNHLNQSDDLTMQMTTTTSAAQAADDEQKTILAQYENDARHAGDGWHAADRTHQRTAAKLSLCEELTCAAAASLAFKRSCFESSRLLMFVVAELRALAPVVRPYIHQQLSVVRTSRNTTSLIEDDVQALRYTNTLYALLGRALHACLHINEARTTLLRANDGRTSLAALLDAILMLRDTSGNELQGSPQQQQQQQRIASAASADHDQSLWLSRQRRHRLTKAQAVQQSTNALQSEKQTKRGSILDTSQLARSPFDLEFGQLTQQDVMRDNDTSDATQLLALKQELIELDYSYAETLYSLACCFDHWSGVPAALQPHISDESLSAAALYRHVSSYDASIQTHVPILFHRFFTLLSSSVQPWKAHVLHCFATQLLGLMRCSPALTRTVQMQHILDYQYACDYSDSAEEDLLAKQKNDAATAAAAQLQRGKKGAALQQALNQAQLQQKAPRPVTMSPMQMVQSINAKSPLLYQRVKAATIEMADLVQLQQQMGGRR